MVNLHTTILGGGMIPMHKHISIFLSVITSCTFIICFLPHSPLDDICTTYKSVSSVSEHMQQTELENKLDRAESIQNLRQSRSERIQKMYYLYRNYMEGS